MALFRISMVLLLALLSTPWNPVLAAEAPGSAAVADPPTASEGPVEVRMGEVEIKGEIERPGVFYIIPRRKVELDLGSQTRDYSAELSRPLDAAAFARWVRLQRVRP